MLMQGCILYLFTTSMYILRMLYISTFSLEIVAVFFYSCVKVYWIYLQCAKSKNNKHFCPKIYKHHAFVTKIVVLCLVHYDICAKKNFFMLEFAFLIAGVISLFWRWRFLLFYHGSTNDCGVSICLLIIYQLSLCDEPNIEFECQSVRSSESQKNGIWPLTSIFHDSLPSHKVFVRFI